MPPRILTLTIVTAWLVMNGWLFYREIWPQLRPGEPVPFHIEMIDETQQKKSPSEERWLVYWTDGRARKQIVCYANTWVAYHPQEDTFELHCKLTQPTALGKGLPFEFRVYDAHQQELTYALENRYLITRQGTLREVHTLLQKERRGLDEIVERNTGFDGRIYEGQLSQKFWMEWTASGNADSRRQEVPMAPVDFPRGCVLNPLHPLNRLVGLTPGRAWRMPILGTMATLMETLRRVGDQAEQERRLVSLAEKLTDPLYSESVQAEVLADVVSLDWCGQDVPCLKIVCRGAAMSGSIWAADSDGRVLRQETTIKDDHWIVERYRPGT